MLKPTILSISLLTIMASAAVSPALGNIAVFFKGTDPFFIKLIITLPSIMIIPFSFISGKLTGYLGKRKVLFTGLFIYLTGGLLGGFFSSIEMILLMRGFLGIGVGLIMPVSTALVSDFYKGKEAVNMTGYITASNNLGGILAVLFSGWLASISWRYSFFVYAIALIPFLLVLFFLPEPEKVEKKGTGKKLPDITIKASFYMFMMMLVFYAIPTNIAMFIKKMQLGNSGTSGIVLAALTGSAFLAGSLFGKLSEFLKDYMAGFSIFLMLSGYLIITFYPVLEYVFLSVFLIGFSFGCLYPMILLLIVKNVPKEENVKSMAVISVAVFSGQFFSPVFFDFAGMVFSNQTMFFIFLLASILSGAGFVISIFKVLTGENVKEADA